MRVLSHVLNAEVICATVQIFLNVQITFYMCYSSDIFKCENNVLHVLPTLTFTV